MKFERIKANNWIRGKKEVEELLNEDARKDGRDENNRGNSSFQSGESINGSPQVVGQYLTYPRLEYQLGHSTVARMGGKSDKLWKKPRLPLSFPRPSATIFTIQCYLPDTYAKRKTIDKRANLIQLSSINNTTYISIHPPSSENVAEVTRRCCIYTIFITIRHPRQLNHSRLKLANYLITSIVYSSKKFSSPSKITKCWTEKVKDLLDCIQRRNSSLFEDNRTTLNYQSQNSIIQETLFTIKITWTKRRDEKSKTKRLRKIYSDNCVRQISGKF